jgi:microcystin-dependent protein
MSSLIPIGTIVPFAGEVVDKLESSGWLLCDGSSVSTTERLELYDVVGTAFGCVAPSEFSLPWLNGMFVRGRQGDAPERTPGGDPNAATRMQLRGGGNFGNEIGSRQRYSTARPRTSFTSSVANGKLVQKWVDGGGDTDVTRWNDSSRTVYADQGGDIESRPQNKYVHFIIKWKHETDDGAPVGIPVGGLLAFAGKDPGGWEGNWKLCDGAALSRLGVFKPLFDVMGFAHGKLDDAQFYLPNYKDYFLRGVNAGDGFDPEAGARGAPMPENPPGSQGNSGNAVGSRQDDGTGLPTLRLFETSYPNLPTSYWREACAVKALGVNVFYDNATGRRINLSEGGGDDETRPVNVSVGWYVRFR